MGRTLQPDGRGTRGDHPTAGGGRGPEPSLRRRRGARAADPAGGTRRRGAHPAPAPRRPARRAPPRRRARAGSRPAESGRAGELLVSDVGRLRSLVDDLMEVSRFDARAEQIAVEPVDLGRVVRMTTATRLPEATIQLPDEPVVIETDPRRFDRIVANLLDNAREH